MGSQQILLLVLSLIIVGVAIAFAIMMFNTWSIKSNKDALINDLNEVSALAYGYLSKAQMMGGGNGSYTGFDLPEDIKSNEDGDITWIIKDGGKLLSLTAISRYGYGTVQADLNDKGVLTNFVFSGDF